MKHKESFKTRTSVKKTNYNFAIQNNCVI